METVRIIVVLVTFAVALVVALSPRIVYAPQPRIVLYFLLSAMLAILLGAEAVAQLKLELPGFALVSSGAAAICFGMLWILTYLSKPEEKIAVFYIVDEKGEPVKIDWKGAIEVLLSDSALQVTTLISGNALVLIFPEQVGEVKIRVHRTSDGPVYTGKVSYAGSRKAELRLGNELTAS